MATKKKLLEAAAGAAGGGDALNVEQVFSTYLYEGNSGTQVIENGIAIGDEYEWDYQFDGTQTSPTTVTPNLGRISTFELSFFFRLNGGSNNQWLITTSQGYSEPSPSEGFLVGLFDYDGNGSRVAIAGEDFGAYGFTGSTILIPKVIYHCVVNYSDSDNTLRVYLNGVLETAGTGGTSFTSAFAKMDSFDLGMGRVTSGGSYVNPVTADLYGFSASATRTHTSNFTPPTQPVANSGEGGLIWVKNRTTGITYNALFDTERGTEKYLISNANSASTTFANNGVTSFNSNGFTIAGTSDWWNLSGEDIVSWTWRKAPKFFDCVEYTGTGVSGLTVSHNLGSTPGCIIIKSTSNAENWQVWHRSVTGNLELDGSSAVNASSIRVTAVSSTDFTLAGFNTSNGSGQTYVAYLFAHNDGDGDFGPTGDQDIIKCGSYTGTGSSQLTVDLGFEPQWLLVKRTDTANDWILHDTMRGFGASGNFTSWLEPNTSDAEATAGADWLEVTSTGFSSTSTQSRVNASGGTYIYIAIRRGPMAVPTAATDVFDVTSATGTGAGQATTTGFPVDTTIVKKETAVASWEVWDRLRGPKPYLFTDSSNAEGAFGSDQWLVDDMTGFSWNSGDGFSNTGGDFVNYSWKRAPNFFDVVAYTGDGVAGKTVSHNLGVVPEMIWIKGRNYVTDWAVYHSALGNTKYLIPNSTAAAGTSSLWWNNTSPTATEFTLGNSSRVNNTSSNTYIAHLFATLDGVSKVGSFTTTGSDVNVDCGFSSGARFVLWKRTDSAGSWNVFDSERGIVAGNDPFLNLNQTSAENNTLDLIDPYSSGFTVVGGGLSSGGTYIFYAIA